MPLPVKRALRKLGNDLRAARLRRRISTAVMAERVMVSRPTLLRMEQGDASVSMGIYATALFVLGLHEPLGSLADISRDPVGQGLDEAALPSRIYSTPRKRTPKER